MKISKHSKRLEDYFRNLEFILYNEHPEGVVDYNCTFEDITIEEDQILVSYKPGITIEITNRHLILYKFEFNFGCEELIPCIYFNPRISLWRTIKSKLNNFFFKGEIHGEMYQSRIPLSCLEISHTIALTRLNKLQSMSNDNLYHYLLNEMGFVEEIRKELSKRSKEND